MKETGLANLGRSGLKAISIWGRKAMVDISCTTVNIHTQTQGSLRHPSELHPGKALPSSHGSNGLQS